MDKNKIYRSLPKVDEILKDKGIKTLLERVPKTVVMDSISKHLDGLRERISTLKDDGSDFDVSCLDMQNVVEAVGKIAETWYAGSLKRVVNGAGVVIHTNMGRSLIDDEIAKSAITSACRYSNLEYDLVSGGRGSRYYHLNDLICRITGAEASHVVNNNASAVMLVLSELARGKEVIVSRGELVEIGGAFRIPEIMALSACKLVEVGTTNKTKLKDYADAITENTAMLLKVHTSNYKIMGFTEEASIEELAGLAREKNLILYQDLGSGSLVDLAKYGIDAEPTVMDSVRQGADVVSFSGDKLLGGPQAGIILGKKEYISRMLKNQLTRALRLDKIVISLLEKTFKVYLDEDKITEKIPTIRMLTLPLLKLRTSANKIKNIFAKSKLFEAVLMDGYSEVGGGSLPTTKLQTKLVAITSSAVSETTLERELRGFETPIICRVHEGKLIIDPRCILQDDMKILSDFVHYFDKKYS